MKQTFKKPSYYLLSQAMDGDEKAIEKILAFYDPYISKCCLRPLYDEYGNVYIVVDINCIQKPYCLRPDIHLCQNRPRIRGRIKNKAQHTYQPRIKIRSKKLVFHLLLPHRCHEIVHYPEKITPKINNNKLWHKRNHFIRRTRKIMSLDSRP